MVLQCVLSADCASFSDCRDEQVVRCLRTNAGPLTSRLGIYGHGHVTKPPCASISSPVKWQ